MMSEHPIINSLSRSDPDSFDGDGEMALHNLGLLYSFELLELTFNAALKHQELKDCALNLNT